MAFLLVVPVETLEQLEAARLGETKQPETKRRAAPARGRRKAREKKRVGHAPEHMVKGDILYQQVGV